MNKKLMALLQLLGLIFFIYMFFRNGELVRNTIQELKDVRWGHLALAGIFCFFSLCLSSFRLKHLIEKNLKKEKSLSFPQFIANMLHVTLLNLFLISGSGELYRIRFLSHFGITKIKAGWIVLVDRIVGMVPVLFGAILGAFFLHISWQDYGLNASILLRASLLAILVLSVFLLSLKNKKWRDLVQQMTLVGKKDWLFLSFISLFAACVWLISMFFVFRAVGLADLNWTVIVFVSCAVIILSVIPISVGGLGVREMGYVSLLANYGVASDKAIAVGLAQYLVAYLAVVLGIPFLIRAKSHLQ